MTATQKWELTLNIAQVEFFLNFYQSNRYESYPRVPFERGKEYLNSQRFIHEASTFISLNVKVKGSFLLPRNH